MIYFFTPQTSSYIVIERGIIDIWYVIKRKKEKIKSDIWKGQVSQYDGSEWLASTIGSQDGLAQWVGTMGRYDSLAQRVDMMAQQVDMMAWRVDMMAWRVGMMAQRAVSLGPTQLAPLGHAGQPAIVIWSFWLDLVFRCARPRAKMGGSANWIPLLLSCVRILNCYLINKSCLKN